MGIVWAKRQRWGRHIDAIWGLVLVMGGIVVVAACWAVYTHQARALILSTQ
jgi:hypothetical protein